MSLIDSSIRPDNVVNIGIADGQRPVVPKQFSEFSSSFKVSRDQNSIAKVDISQFRLDQIGGTQSSPFQVGVSEVAIFPSAIGQISKSQISPFTIDLPSIYFSKTGSPQVSLTQINPFQVSYSDEIDSDEIGSHQIDIGEIRFIQDRFSQDSSSQISFLEDSASEIDFSQVSTFEVSSGEVSLPSSISSEQFFSIHNATPQTLNHLDSTAQPLWQSHFNRQSPPEIILEITELPTDQLAEAQLNERETYYDMNGRTITYQAPFAKCDREEDYRIVWEAFKEKTL